MVWYRLKRFSLFFVWLIDIDVGRHDLTGKVKKPTIDQLTI